MLRVHLKILFFLLFLESFDLLDKSKTLRSNFFSFCLLFTAKFPDEKRQDEGEDEN